MLVWIVFLILFIYCMQYTMGWSVAKYAIVGSVIAVIILVAEGFPAIVNWRRNKRQLQSLDPHPFPDNSSMLFSTLSSAKKMQQPGQQPFPDTMQQPFPGPMQQPFPDPMQQPSPYTMQQPFPDPMQQPFPESVQQPGQQNQDIPGTNHSWKNKRKFNNRR
ncbi:protein TsetseEP-like [Penaeus monodon]|uniref:protein TsetseEP-like n=1 Tax=Penaeus monodon TaxID=6687 RepID=UPI0018A7D2F0|nr:protein TsetseEP-like [Penaeus monodon]